jgi:class 3 adenylate cyclase/predicted ATPase
VDVAAWLHDLGLGRYGQAFRENEIDSDVLRELTESDLEKLGIPLGHRKKLLRAIAGLSAAEADPRAAPGAVSSAPPRPLEAERRQLTVMFIDLVGSTELAARLDPEDMAAAIRAYHGACAAAVERWGGHVAKYMGDGVLAYFGWPQAHEDEAERAVRAGLELVKAVDALEAPGVGSGGGREQGQPLAARVGIATGLVMVGELIGEGAAKEQTVVGETPNLAARLQALALPGSVVISGATRRLVGGLFELADLGPVRLKGFAEALSAFRVEGEGRAEGRFDALHGEHLTPLVGRAHELGILLERWAWARDGDGQVVLLAGEPGIGKSRMLRTLRERLGDEPHTALSHYCSPHHTNSALYPVIDLLERAVQLDRDAPLEEQLKKLEAVLVGTRERLDETAPLLAALIGVPTGAHYPAPTMPPEVQKRRTMQALVDQLAALAARQPVLALYEDVHWIDPSTLELLGMVIERVRQLPVLVLITFRPEFQPPWTGHAHVTALTMGRLGRRQGADLVTRVTGAKPLPAEVVEQIVARTDGVPLFVEELTKTVLESGLLRDAGERYELFGPLPPLAIPTTLHDSLMARLDRLAPVKEVAQSAAAIGREFSYELLAAVSPLPGPDLASALDQLVTSELIFRRGAPPEATYTFKHALVQDAAYQTLLKSKRQQLHARIAETLEERFHDLAKSRPELLAHHFAEAGLFDKAVLYWVTAARQSVDRSAMVEAVTQARNGLDLLGRLPEHAGRAQKELELQSVLAAALVATVGNAALETGQAYARARELCEQLGDTLTLVPVLSGLSTFHQTRSDFAAMRRTAFDLLQLGERLGDRASALVGHRSTGLCLFHLGEFHSAREHLERVLSMYVPGEHHLLASIAAFDMRAAALTYLPLSLLILGYPDQARQWHEQALPWSRSLGHPHTLAFSLHYAAFFHLLGRDAPSGVEAIDELSSLAAEQRFPIWLAGADIMRGYLLAGRDKAAMALPLARKGLAQRQATGSSWHDTYFLGLLAWIAQDAGESDEAHRLLESALAMASRTGERWYEAELYRLRGQCLIAHQQCAGAAAQTCFRRAIAAAQSQQAKLWELRAATSLSRLWAEQGKRAQARDLLAPVYGWFTEGFDTADLKDAKGLLDELS